MAPRKTAETRANSSLPDVPRSRDANAQPKRMRGDRATLGPKTWVPHACTFNKAVLRRQHGLPVRDLQALAGMSIEKEDTVGRALGVLQSKRGRQAEQAER